jgi:hypothetical protein
MEVIGEFKFPAAEKNLDAAKYTIQNIRTVI